MLSEGHDFVLPLLMLGGRGMSGTSGGKSLSLTFSATFYLQSLALQSGSQHAQPLSPFPTLTGLLLSPNSCSWETRESGDLEAPHVFSCFILALGLCSSLMWPRRPCQLSPCTCPPAQFLPPVTRGDRADRHHLHQGARGENQGPGIVPVRYFLFFVHV